ncbi:hypothetical protein BC834DRAFT_1036500 [Gloeopeniophorella convolvens]|nr:hypothetical protein BC834DRAFT_1036500 [Gloeopeniophorella convolvens]
MIKLFLRSRGILTNPRRFAVAREGREALGPMQESAENGGELSRDELVGALENGCLETLASWRKVHMRDIEDHIRFTEYVYRVHAGRAEDLLREEKFYNLYVIARHHEDRDPELALLAYSKGCFDEAILALTDKHVMLEQQARYVLQRGSKDLWGRVLGSNETHRQRFIDQLEITILEHDEEEDIAIAMKALFTAGLFPELAASLVQSDSVTSDTWSYKTLCKRVATSTCFSKDPRGGVGAGKRQGDTVKPANNPWVRQSTQA